MADIPNLAGAATADLVEKIGSGNFQASYINWSRTVNLLRIHAPGWMPELVRNADGGLIHRAPIGGYLMIRFRHADGTLTPEVPQAIMDTRNNAVHLEDITARDVTDTHRRGVCMAAAFTFGLAYELWAKMPLESGYAEQEKPPALKVKPTDGVWDALDEDEREFLLGHAKHIASIGPSRPADMVNYVDAQNFDNDEKMALWTQLDSKIRTAIKAEMKNRVAAAKAGESE